MSTKLLGPAKDPRDCAERSVIVDAIPGRQMTPTLRDKVVISIDVVQEYDLGLIIMTPPVADRLIESLRSAVRVTTTPAAIWTAEDFLRDVVEPALDLLRMNSASARALLMGTAAVESDLTHVRQIGGGPARGFFQMEPATALDILRWVDGRHPYLRKILGVDPDPLGVGPDIDIAELLETADIFAAAMARLHYRRIPAALPDADDVQGLAEYWKRYYNTRLGKGTVAKFVAKFALVADALAAREARGETS
jgi:hypothetical protein